ncbi:hypothetical protein GQR58_019154 [Nymphon striatum]|nr:hypothetical protein GQR58_019154 [Nymphon striatum]
MIEELRTASNKVGGALSYNIIIISIHGLRYDEQPLQVEQKGNIILLSHLCVLLLFLITFLRICAVPIQGLQTSEGYKCCAVLKFYRAIAILRSCTKNNFSFEYNLSFDYKNLPRWQKTGICSTDDGLSEKHSVENSLWGRVCYSGPRSNSIGCREYHTKNLPESDFRKHLTPKKLQANVLWCFPVILALMYNISKKIPYGGGGFVILAHGLYDVVITQWNVLCRDPLASLECCFGTFVKSELHLDVTGYLLPRVKHSS